MTLMKYKEKPGGLPHSLWPAEAIAGLEKQGADALGLTLYELMLRAGEAVFNLLRQRWPHVECLLILCGHGNNGGDGYVVARLAQLAGLTVTLIACEGTKPLPAEAEKAKSAWLAAGGVIFAPETPWPKRVELIVDALLGTGFNHPVREPYASLFEMANDHPAPVLSVDIPSGLVAAKGTSPGPAIEAEATLTFIGLKPGLLTGKARDHVGHLYCHALGLDQWLHGQCAPWARVDTNSLAGWLMPRRASSHKGDNGRLVIIGGDCGTAGAIRLAAEAALRSGAGLVRVLTLSDNIGPLLTARPELMVNELNDMTIDSALEWCDVIVIGPGLGQRSWGKNALIRIEKSPKPMLWDADALNLLAIRPDKRQNRIITPHPGEAARLLNAKISEIESDRLLAAQRLVKRYGGVVVLKGAGTIVASQQDQLAIADVGNAGMASGGMGDVLSGIIGALIGQKLSLYDAACAGCVVHGAAADRVASFQGMRGMLASDLFPQLYPYLNPEMLTPLT